MQIISKETFENGGYPPIQSWDGPALPDGYAIVPDDLGNAVFYAYNGFVTLAIEDDIVTAMEPNIEAWEAWKSSLPTPEPPAPTTEERLRADVDYIAVMTGVSL